MNQNKENRPETGIFPYQIGVKFILAPTRYLSHSERKSVKACSNNTDRCECTLPKIWGLVCIHPTWVQSCYALP